MGLFGRFRQWLTSSPADSYKKGHPDLNPIDVPQLVAELGLLAEARRLGEKNIPATDETSLTGPEAQALQRVEKCRQDYVDWAKTRLAVINTDLQRQEIAGRINQARQADREFERRAAALLSEQEAILRSFGQASASRKQELEDFKSEHGLKRDARYPTHAWAVVGYALLPLMTVFEGAVNAQFFATGVTGGLIEGFGLAFMLAGVNVLIAYLLGRFFVRFVHHRRLALKLCGVGALALSVIAMAAIGLGIAHYRDALNAENAEAARAALEAYKAHPLDLKDVFSWVLFGVTVMFGGGALYDGLKADDSYPGYGRLARAARDAEENYESELDHLRTKVNELKDEELELLEETVRHASASITRFSELIQSKSAAHSRLMTALRDADNSLEAVLKQFRTENQLHRTAPRPRYFSESPQLRYLELPDFDTANDERALQEQKDLVAILEREVQDIRGRIQAAFNSQFDRLKPLNSNFPVKVAA
jgi:hypothetical protein